MGPMWPVQVAVYIDTLYAVLNYPDASEIWLPPLAGQSHGSIASCQQQSYAGLDTVSGAVEAV